MGPLSSKTATISIEITIGILYNLRLMSQQETAPLSPDPIRIYESQCGQILMDNEPLRIKVNEFMTRVRATYDPMQADYVRRALVLGIAGHQGNENEAKRFRKQVDSAGQRAPYIYHPMEMAERMISPQGSEPALDWMSVAATLIHDVPEDVVLGNVQGREPWLQEIRSVFADTRQGELIAEIVDGVSERALPTDPSEKASLCTRLSKSPVYMMIDSYVHRGGMKHPRPAQPVADDVKEAFAQEKLYGVVYNLENLFASATKSPEHLRVFFIKVADLWHNLQSPDHVSPNKILRGRIAANLAGQLGWFSMRNELIRSLARVTDVVSPWAPGGGSQEKLMWTDDLDERAKKEMDRCLSTVRGLLPQFLWRLYDNESKPDYTLSGGYPVPHRVRTRGLVYSMTVDGVRTTIPQPEIRVVMSNDDVRGIREKLLAKKCNRFSSRVRNPNNKGGKSTAHITREENDLVKFITELGRNTLMFKGSGGTAQSFSIRIESDEPHIIDMLGNRRHKVQPSEIPEYPRFTVPKYHNDQQRKLHLQTMIASFYDLGQIGKQGKSGVPVWHTATRTLYFLSPTRLGETIKNLRLGDIERIQRAWHRTSLANLVII